MIRTLSYRPGNADSEDLKERYRGIVSLPKVLFPDDEARNLEAARWAAEDARVVDMDVVDPLVPHTETDSLRRSMASPGTRFAQTVIPIPRLFPVLPPLRYDGGRRGAPPRGPGPHSRRKSDGQCEAEYARNLAQCDEYYPRAQFPGLDLDPRGRRLCKSEAFRVYSDCETGRKSKPFDPTLFYER